MGGTGENATLWKGNTMRSLGWTVSWVGVTWAMSLSAQAQEEPQGRLAGVPVEEQPLAAPAAVEASPQSLTATDEANGKAKATPIVQLGSSAQPQASPEVQPRAEPPVGAYGGPKVSDEDGWKFSYSGYFRAPMRTGIGKRDAPLAGQSATTFHAPLVPDDQYLSWQSTKHQRKDWAELFFSYGNSWAKGVVALQGFNFTDASAYQNGSQFGIGQGWLELTPKLPVDSVRLWAKAGSFWSRYGQMGQWDAGEYDTYLFGRTHVMGATVRVELDVPDQPLTIGLEDGVGAKRPDAQIYNAARYTLLHHAHADLNFDGQIRLSGHFLHAFASEEARFTGPQPAWVYPSDYVNRYNGQGQPDGRMMVFGGDARFDMPDVFGYLYLGASHIALKDSVTVAPAIEVIHSYGGGEFNMGLTGNYLDSEVCRWGIGGYSTCSGGNGSITTLAGQYVTRVSDWMTNSPLGDGRDLTLKLYGMFNWIKSRDPLNDGMSKFKVGTDVSFDAFESLALATRFDYLSPNSRVKNQAFSILSPRVVFRSNWVTHEQIALQYSHYFYAKRECDVGTPADIQRAAVASGAAIGTSAWDFAEPSAEEMDCVQPPPSPVTPDGFGASTENQDIRLRGMPVTGAHLRPDVNVVSIEASMWW